MATIIAGIFDTLEAAENAKAKLQAAAFGDKDISVFTVNAPGQHDLYPAGGDQDSDVEASTAHTGAAKGALMGGAAALGVGVAVVAATAAAPIVAVGAAAVGAYTGSLVGALNSLSEKSEEVPPAKALERHAGVMVAVNVSSSTEQSAVSLLIAQGAHTVERAQGEWNNGEWTNFDPRIPPNLITNSATPTPGHG